VLALSFDVSAWAAAGDGLISGSGEVLGDGTAASPGLGEATGEAAAWAGLGLGLGAEACEDGRVVGVVVVAGAWFA
jgi:hypothetical protein